MSRPNTGMILAMIGDTLCKLEKILPAAADIIYPKFIDGKMACPPEDCGGVRGYYELIEVFKNPKTKRYKEMFDWLGGKYDPEYFDPNEIKFDNPAKRLKELLKQHKQG